MHTPMYNIRTRILCGVTCPCNLVSYHSKDLLNFQSSVCFVSEEYDMFSSHDAARYMAWVQKI